MEKRDKVKSILEFLTAKNPEITHPKPRSLTLSSSPEWHRPKELKEWKEFSFQTIEEIYGGRLMHEALRKDRDLEFPRMNRKVDCIDKNEPATTHTYTTWNHRIVTESLDLVNDFNPCYWFAWSGDSDDSSAEEQEQRLSNQDNKARRTKKRRSRPDAGGLSMSSGNGDESSMKFTEKLPKDYKVASKWKSTDITARIDSSGAWKQGTNKDKKIDPIKQIYSYCVNRGCRYGCLLTTEEAFIFRIRPRTAQSGPCEDRKKLRDSLVTDGLMEWVSIPWDNHRVEDLEDYKGLTVNLSLWFIHILAGNHHEIAWDYCNLASEKLAQEKTPTRDLLDSTEIASDERLKKDKQPVSNSQNPALFTLKRKRHAIDENTFHLSFTESQPFDTQLTGYGTEASVDSDSSSLLEGENETTGGTQGSEKLEDVTVDDSRRSVKRRRSRRIMAQINRA